MTARTSLAYVCISGVLAISCFSGDVADPGAYGPVEGGPRSLIVGNGAGGSGSQGVGGNNNVCQVPPCPSNGSGGSGNVSVAKWTSILDNINIQSMALDDQNVYATSDRGLMRIPKNGDKATPLGILQQGSSTGIAVDATNVYYPDNSGAIQAVPKDGGAAKQIVPAGMGGGGGALILDGDMFYYTVGPFLRRAPVSGGAFTDLSSAVEQQNFNLRQRLAVDSTYVYFVSAMMNLGPNTTIISALPKAGGAIIPLEKPKGTVQALVPRMDDVAGVVFTDYYALGSNTVEVRATTLTSQTMSLASISFMGGYMNAGSVLTVDLDGSRLFFPGAPGLLALAKDGTITTLDATVQVNVIAVDGSNIYFADSGGGGGVGGTQIVPGLKKMPK